MDLTETEKKLLRLGLNAAAKSGEIDASAIKFFRQLRKRKISFEEFTGDNDKDALSALAAMAKAAVGRMRMEREPEELNWKEIAIKQQTKIKIQERRIKQLENELVKKHKKQ